MDTLSHALYGGVVFGTKHKFSYWKAFLFGALPDLLSFGILFVLTLLSIEAGPDYGAGKPDPSDVPLYVHQLYDITHSLVVAAVVIAIVWFGFKKPMVELFAWPLHILVDIPTHTKEFFPTPFLWPVSSYEFDGISWATPIIYIPNLIVLAILYIGFYLYKKKA